MSASPLTHGHIFIFLVFILTFSFTFKAAQASSSVPFKTHEESPLEERQQKHDAVERCHVMRTADPVDIHITKLKQVWKRAFIKKALFKRSKDEMNKQSIP